MISHMLDTNMVSHLMRGHPAVARRLTALPMASLCISAITHGELMFGLAKRPEARRLHAAVHEFLLCVDILPGIGPPRNVTVPCGPATPAWATSLPRSISRSARMH